MTIIAKITTEERDAELAAHIRAADLEIARFMQRLAPTGNLLAARQRLAAALAARQRLAAALEAIQSKEWTTEQILEREG